MGRIRRRPHLEALHHLLLPAQYSLSLATLFDFLPFLLRLIFPVCASPPPPASVLARLSSFKERSTAPRQVLRVCKAFIQCVWCAQGQALRGKRMGRGGQRSVAEGIAEEECWARRGRVGGWGAGSQQRKIAVHAKHVAIKEGG